MRCIPQILGPVYDELLNAEKVLINEINSACDNPIVDPDTQNVYHGGNFHGDYVSFEMDKLKIAVTKLAMLAERQINYLFHDRINGILPLCQYGSAGIELWFAGVTIYRDFYHSGVPDFVQSDVCA